MGKAFAGEGEVLVTGGTGFLGHQVVRALVGRGYLPRLLVREGSGERIPAEIRNVCRLATGDVTDHGSVDDAMAGAAAVVHLAGIVREFPPRGLTFERIHVKATRNVVKAARRREIGRIVHVSALGARAGGPGVFLDSKGRGEEIVRNSDLRWTIFRPSVIFGPGDRFIDTLLGIVRRSPAVPVPGDGRARYRPVYAGDVAYAVADALARPRTVECSVDLGGPETLSLDEIVAAVAGALGRRRATVHVPMGLLRPLARAFSRFRAFPFSPEEIGFLAADNVCESAPYWVEVGRAPLSLGDYLDRVASGGKGAPAPGPRAGTRRDAGGRSEEPRERPAPPSRDAA